MTPAARLQTAIEILDAILDGAPAERELTRWARANRVAGSGDRAAIRDHVYTVLRCRESFCVLGGGLSGRRLILGMLRAQEADPEMLFTGERFAPLPLRASERAALRTPIPGNLARRDWPAWLLPELEHSLGSDLDAVSEAMRTRAPVFLRVNASKADLHRAQALLRADGIVTQPHPLAATALAVTEGEQTVPGFDAQ